MLMDSALEALLEESVVGVSRETKQVLVDEGIVSKFIFWSLREEHFERLLSKLKVGQHAILLKIWDRFSNWRSRVRRIKYDIQLLKRQSVLHNFPFYDIVHVNNKRHIL